MSSSSSSSSSSQPPPQTTTTTTPPLPTEKAMPTSPIKCTPTSSKDNQHVCEGDTLILDFADKQFFVQATKKLSHDYIGYLKLGKVKVYTDKLVSMPYGAVVEVVKSSLVRTDDDCMAPKIEFENDDNDDNEENDNEENLDNRNIEDKNTAQKMSVDDINKMKSEGKTGGDVIAALITNSTTFAGKTEFSKAKYIKRKQKKYQPRARIVRCNAATVCSALFRKNPMKVMNLREDALSQILSYSNIFAGSQVLCFDSTGIVVAALVERMGGYGRLLAAYVGQEAPFRDMLSRFNFTYSELDVIKWISCYEIFGEGAANRLIAAAAAAATGKDDSFTTSPSPLKDITEEEKQDLMCQGWPVPLKEHTREFLMQDPQHANDKAQDLFLLKRSSRFIRKLTRPSLVETLSYLDKKSDSLIIATKYDAISVLMSMLPHLAASCPFVVFNERLEPLIECFNELKKKNLAIKLQMSETWQREYQVLPNCTHPQMLMSATGGYILTGVKVSENKIEVQKKGKLVGAGIGPGRNRENRKQNDRSAENAANANANVAKKPKREDP